MDSLTKELNNLRSYNKLKKARFRGEQNINRLDDAGLMELSLIYSKMSLYQNAENCLDRFKHTNSPYYKYAKAQIKYGRSKYREAIALVTSINFAEKEYTNELNEFLLDCYIKVNISPEIALEHLEKMKKQRGNKKRIIVESIRFLSQAGRKDEAERQLIKLSLLNADVADVMKAREFLNKEYHQQQVQPETKPEITPKDNNIASDDPLDELKNFIGLQPVKDAVIKLIKEIEFNKQRKVLVNTINQVDSSFHFIFKGNPGTGKTTIARILGKIFKKYGLLEKGHLVETDRSGLVGQYIGESAQKTNALIQEAMGGILFIDEAYALYRSDDNSKDFGIEAIDVLIKAMEDNRDSLCIIMAGYDKEMDILMNANPGLKSRLDFEIEFPDYTDSELIQIAESMANERTYKLNDKSRQALLEKIDFERVDDKFGNARVVRNLIETSIRNKAVALAGKNFTSEEAVVLTEEDFGVISIEEREKLMDDAISELNELIGMNELKQQVLDIKDFIRHQLKLAQMKRAKKGMSYHMVFRGNPGTGKTTVARVLAKIFKSLGILKKGHMVEVGRDDLVAGHVGQTAEKTKKVIKKAVGGVLFIDEAYSLCVGGENDFGSEAINTMIKYMEDYRENLVIILAGYEKEMDDLLDMNPGFDSRIKFKFDFPDYSEDELFEIFMMYCNNEAYSLTDSGIKTCKEKINDIYMSKDSNFGNARTIRNLFEKVKMDQAVRFSKQSVPDELITTIDGVDF